MPALLTRPSRAVETGHAPATADADRAHLATKSATVYAPDLVATRDLVAIDMRGGAVKCADYSTLRGADLTPDDDSGWAVLDGHWREFAESCVGAHGAERLAAFGSRQNAADVDCLLSAMGETSEDFMGFSYGTLAGAALAGAFPTRVKNMVLEAAAAPAKDFVSYFAQRARAVERELGRQVVACSEDSSCPFHGGETEAEILSAFDALVLGLSGGLPVGDRTLTGSDLHMSVYNAMATNRAGLLWSTLAALEMGDGAPLLALADEAWPANPKGRFYALAPNDLPCPPGWSLADAQAAFQAVSLDAPRVAPAIMTNALVCLHWPVAAQPPPLGTSAPPALVIGGNLDVLSPVEGAAQLAAALGNESRVFLHDVSGHVAFYNDECVRSVALGFLQTRALPASDKACP